MCNMGPETEPFTHQRKVQNIGNAIAETDKQLAGTHDPDNIMNQHLLTLVGHIISLFIVGLC
jgi:hypothetical protein